jgi:hypothetical protein
MLVWNQSFDCEAMMRPLPFLPNVLLFLAVSLATGCGVSRTWTPAPGVHPQGTVFGGQQPVSGATIQLYTVGTAGDASAAQPLLTTSVTTDTNGFFTITGDYNCNNATQVYLTATGGNPGLSAPNPNLLMMAALGPCSALTANTNIWVNELTTVAAAYALAPYATSATSIGSGTSDAPALAKAFTLANQYVNTTTGQAPGLNIPSGYNAPTALLNTLANILSVCINSNGGVANDGSTLCGTLFGLTPSSAGTSPTDTFTSILNLAKNPGTNTAAIFNLAPAIAPFQPVLPQIPPDFNVRITSASGGTFLTIQPGTPSFFGDEPVNSLTEYVSVELSNAITAPDVTVTAFNIIGPNAGDFTTLFNHGCSPGTVLGADVNQLTCTVDISAKPSGIGERLAYLQIFSNAPDSPYYVKLYLSGTNVLTTPVRIYRSAGLIEEYQATASSGYGAIGGGGGNFIYGALRADYVGNLYTFSQLYPVGSGFAITSGNIDKGELPLGTGPSTFNPIPPTGYSFNGGGNTISATTNFAADNQGQIYIPIQTADAVPQIGIAVYPPQSTGTTAPSFVINGYGGKVAVDTIGTLYALDSTGEINFFQGGVFPGKAPVGGDPLTDQLGTGPNARVIDMATDGNNDVISLIYGTNGYEVVAYSINQYGQGLLHKTFYGAISQLNQPTSIAADGVGDIFVNDTSPTTNKPVILVFAGNGGNANTAPSAVVTTQNATPPGGIAVR